MFKKIIDWLDWNVRIRFIDEIWTPLFPPDETPKLKMSGALLKFHRQNFGLTPKAMATMLHVSVSQYKQWEINGLHGPHDTEGPASVIVRVIVNILEEMKDKKEMLDIFGYKGKMD